jgi:hypothetical protein
MAQSTRKPTDSNGNSRNGEASDSVLDQVRPPSPNQGRRLPGLVVVVGGALDSVVGQGVLVKIAAL